MSLVRRPSLPSQRFVTASHYANAAAFLNAGVSQLLAAQGRPMFAALALASAAFVLGTTIFHKAAARRFRQVGAVSSSLEALIAGMEGWEAYTHGSHAIHLAWGAAAALALTASVFQWIAARRHNLHT